jgi:uncharacterized protein with HEPN domain
MKLEAKKLLFDLIAACSDVAQFTAGRALEDYLASELLRAAVERKFEIIGEALVRLRAKDPETFDLISAGQRAIAFRNRLVHGYDAIDHKTVWETVQNDLAASKPKLNICSPRNPTTSYERKGIREIDLSPCSLSLLSIASLTNRPPPRAPPRRLSNPS